MGQVTININGRDYNIACDDGQESHLIKLSEFVDKRLKELVTAVGQVGDARLLVMTSLLLADELSDVYTELDVAQKRENSTRKPGFMSGLSTSDLNVFASRIEKIAEHLEQS